MTNQPELQAEIQRLKAENHNLMTTCGVCTAKRLTRELKKKDVEIQRLKEKFNEEVTNCHQLSADVRALLEEMRDALNTALNNCLIASDETRDVVSG